MLQSISAQIWDPDLAWLPWRWKNRGKSVLRRIVFGTRYRYHGNSRPSSNARDHHGCRNVPMVMSKSGSVIVSELRGRGECAMPALYCGITHSTHTACSILASCDNNCNHGNSGISANSTASLTVHPKYCSLSPRGFSSSSTPCDRWRLSIPSPTQVLTVFCLLSLLVDYASASCYVYPPGVKDPCEDKRCDFGAQCVRSLDGLHARCECIEKCNNYGDSVGSKPVCGSDGKDYNNVCELERASCVNMKDISVRYEGRCGKLQTFLLQEYSFLLQEYKLCLA